MGVVEVVVVVDMYSVLRHIRYCTQQETQS